MTIRSLPTAHIAPRAPRPSIWHLLAVWRSRQALARLDSAALEDIGLSKAQAAAEADRPIWDVPPHWRQ